MASTTDTALLPIIVADLADANDRAFLEEIARNAGTVLVPLLAAPSDNGEHVLEVFVPNEKEPTRFLATPVGAPQPEGFPLELRPFAKMTDPRPLHEAKITETPSVIARAPRADHKLSERHTEDLDRMHAPRSKELDLVGRDIDAGKLHIEARLGSGGVGAVYRATHRDLQKEVAVKVLREGAQRDLEFCKRFHAEALAASRLDHPNLIRVIDFGQEPDGLLYLSMEFLDGMSLQDLLDQERKLPMDRALEIMVQVLAGLWHAHARGIVHRDVKPANMMLVAGHDDDGHPIEVVKVCDFGIALQPTSNESERGIAGTPEYMSPEQCQGAPLDGRADVYACGVMLFELVTGRLPFDAETAVEYARHHVMTAPPAPSSFMQDIDPLLESVILKAMSKSPDDRFPSARDFRNALKELLVPAVTPDAEGPVVSTPNPPVTSQAAPVIAIKPAAGVAGAPPSSSDASGNSGREEWIEDARTSYDNFFTSVANTMESAQYHDSDDLATALALAPAERLNEIAILRGGANFAPEAGKLEVAAKILARRGDGVALSHIVRSMAAIYAEVANRGDGVIADSAREANAACALRVLHTIADPITLGPFAEKILTAKTDPSDAAKSLIVWARVGGAHALYSARLKQGSLVPRARFVALMRALDTLATPILRAALDRLLPAHESSVEDPALALDLLRSVPHSRDDAMGSIVARYARIAEPKDLAREAIAALIFAWGERAIPVLLSALQFPDEGVNIAALRGLADLEGVDEIVVRKMEALLDSGKPSTDDFRVAIADALARATPRARATATRIVFNAFQRGESMMSVVRGARPSTTVTIALARAAFSLAPDDARVLIGARAEKSADPLKAQLLALVPQKSAPRGSAAPR